MAASCTGGVLDASKRGDQTAPAGRCARGRPLTSFDLCDRDGVGGRVAFWGRGGLGDAGDRPVSGRPPGTVYAVEPSNLGNFACPP